MYFFMMIRIATKLNAISSTFHSQPTVLIIQLMGHKQPPAFDLPRFRERTKLNFPWHENPLSPLWIS